MTKPLYSDERPRRLAISLIAAMTMAMTLIRQVSVGQVHFKAKPSWRRGHRF